MARPPVLQKLKHGKLLTGGAFRFFVETWNWLVGYTDNLKGDADLNAANGHAIVDRSDPDHPVIRIINLPRGGGGGNVTGEGVTNGCFALVVAKDEDDLPVSCSFINRYYNCDNLTLETTDLTLTNGNVFVALKVTTDLSHSSPTATIVTYASLAAIQADQRALAYVVIPLYHLDSDFSILCDFRVAPLARAGEVI